MTALTTDTMIGVVGAGTMGAGIAQVAAAAGHPVRLFDARDGAVAAGLERTRRGLDRLIERGRKSAGEVEALMARIRPAGSLAELAEAGLVIEAIVEDLAAKQSLFSELETHCAPRAVLATNTSSIPITAIATGLERPERLVGLHFFNPAPILKLVEVVSGLATEPAVAETAFDTAAAWGKQPVHARSTPGFIVNRVARPFYAEALRVLEEGGADAATVDAVLRQAGGFRMGPFELMDLIGHDVNFAVTRSVYEAYFHDRRFVPSLLQQELLAAGRLGRKSGIGFYDYREGAAPPAPATAEASSAPRQITVRGDLDVAAALTPRLERAGIAVAHADGPGVIEADGVTLALTDGRPATRHAAEAGIADLVVFDLALDYGKVDRLAVAAADQARPEAVRTAAGLLQATGIAVSVLDDVPGLIVMRTVCMLANEGADAVHQGVCSVEAVDIAMRGGVNYPRGPMAWADDIGVERVVGTLDNLDATYGDGRYRVSPLLRRRLYAGGRLHE